MTDDDSLKIDKLIENLNSDHDRRVRIAAAEALGEIGDGRAVEPLSKTLGGEDEYVRRYAAEALGEIGDKRAVEPLIRVLLDDDGHPNEFSLAELEAGVRKSAVGALGKIGDARAIDTLTWELMCGGEALDNDDTAASHCKAVPGALAQIGECMRAQGVSVDRESIEPLIEGRQDVPSDYHGSINDRYGWWPPLLAAKSLEGLGWKPETDEQKAAYLIAKRDWESLVEWGEPAVEPLIETLEDAEWHGATDVANAAKEALKKLGHEVE